MVKSGIIAASFLFLGIGVANATIMSMVATMNGTLRIADGFSTLDGKPIEGLPRNPTMSVDQAVPKVGKAEILLLSSGAPGPCGIRYRILDVTGKIPVATEQFGTCAPTHVFAREGDLVTIRFLRWGQIPEATWTYQHGVLERRGPDLRYHEG